MPLASSASEASRCSSPQRSTSSCRAGEDPEPVFKKEELLRDVWGFRSLGRTRTLDSHANRLRRKLNRSPETAYILDVWGVDYRLVATAG